MSGYLHVTSIKCKHHSEKNEVEVEDARQPEPTDAQSERNSITTERKPMKDVEKAIVALLERQEDVEERKRMENRRNVRLEQEINLTAKLLQEATSRLESLDGEIESHRSRILEGQKYFNALEALCEEEVFKARGLRETVGQMQDHADEQRELIGTFYNHLLKKGVPKQDLDATVMFGKGHR